MSTSRRDTGSVSNVVQGPWLRPEAAVSMPNLRHAFDHARDPTISAQLDDLQKSETWRRGEGTGTRAQREDRPQPALKPRHAALNPAPAQTPGSWLGAQHAQAMAQASQASRSSVPAPQHTLETGRPPPHPSDTF
ncbi:MAG: hypothetical protein ACFB2Z_09165 [Maricaulaceae bacterium]